MTPLPPRRMCLYLPFLSTDQVRRAQGTNVSAGQILVLTQAVGLAHVVARVDAAGWQAGLRPEMSLAQARAVAPGLTALPFDEQRDHAVLQKLADWAVRFSPLVEPCAPNTLLIDITGCESLFGGQERIAALALAGLAEAGFLARAAIADTVGAACALAGTALQPISVAPPGETGARLAPLPPTALRLEPQAASRLEVLGILTIGDLLKLPRSELPARFGRNLNLRLQQALGEVFEGIPVRLPQSAPQARLEFEPPLRELAAVQAAAAGALKELFAELRQRGHALRRLDVFLLFDHRPQWFAIGLARASHRRDHVWQLLQQQLEKCDLDAGITGLLLMAGDISRSPAAQGDLFQPDQEPQQDEQLGFLLDRLAGRLGPQSVLRAELMDDYQPELAVGYSSTVNEPESPRPKGRTEPPVPSRGPTSPRAARAASRGRRRPARPEPKPVARVTPLRPTRLLVRPVPIRVISRVPDGPPTWFCYHDREYRIRAAFGPERIQTGWWRGPDVSRDYFRLETETGEQFWVYRAFNDQRWYLHGVFV
jgi:protein ImuB